MENLKHSKFLTVKVLGQTDLRSNTGFGAYWLCDLEQITLTH